VCWRRSVGIGRSWIVLPRREPFVYIGLDEWVEIAAIVLGTDPMSIRQLADLGLADSALHAPSAGFGDKDFYPLH
jgi:hypothetical protein